MIIYNEICASYQRGQVKELEGILKLVDHHMNDEIKVDADFMVAVALKETDEMV